MSKYKTFAVRVIALIAYEGLATFGLSAGVGRADQRRTHGGTVAISSRYTRNRSQLN